MTVAALAPFTRQRFFSPTGQPLSYGLVSTYAAGTTIPIATYIDSTGTIQNTNPIILDAFGGCSCWMLPNVGYKVNVTDQFGNQQPGYPVDNIYNAQQNFYGGVDTGSANAYILNFNAGFSSLSNGILIYWIPAHTNTGASTLNVNGLGAIPILNQDGSPLGSGQIIANGVTAVFYYNGNWLLTSSTASQTQTGIFLGSLTSGLNVSPMSCKYTITGNVCTLLLGYATLLISGGALSMTGLPTVCQPATVIETVRVPLATNNGAAIDTCIAQISPASGTINFYVKAADYGSATWVSSASIGLHVGIFNYTTTLTYALF